MTIDTRLWLHKGIRFSMVANLTEIQ